MALMWRNVGRPGAPRWETSDGSGKLSVTRSPRTRRWYLMREMFLQSPIVLGDYATRGAAQAAAER